MPSTKDLNNVDVGSFLLIGDGGTHKTFFIGTCPRPAYIFALENGLSILAGQEDIDYDFFIEAPKGQKPSNILTEWGTAWPKFIGKLNEIGQSIDRGDCKYKTIGIDSLTMLTDIAISFILRANNRANMERQDWGAFLNNMSAVFSQLTSWNQLIKVATAHVRRMENDLTQVEEKLPLIPGQFAGKVPIYFDEVYYTNVTSTKDKSGTKRLSWTMQTMPDAITRQAKSRRLNLPDGLETSFESVRKHLNGAGGKV